MRLANDWPWAFCHKLLQEILLQWFQQIETVVFKPKLCDGRLHQLLFKNDCVLQVYLSILAEGKEERSSLYHTIRSVINHCCLTSVLRGKFGNNLMEHFITIKSIKIYDNIRHCGANSVKWHALSAHTLGVIPSKPLPRLKLNRYARRRKGIHTLMYRGAIFFLEFSLPAQSQKNHLLLRFPAFCRWCIYSRSSAVLFVIMLYSSGTWVVGH